MPAGNISDSSRRIAKNTVLLYFRMFVLMVVGLFTSRIVLQKLGVDDFGVYGAVGGVVAMFTVVTASLSNAIGRYMTFSLGKGDVERLRRVFSTSVTLQLILCAVILTAIIKTHSLKCTPREFAKPKESRPKRK